VQELLNGIKEFVDSDESEDKTLSAFLQSVSLLTNADEPDDNNDNDRVTMMTIHSAKGLEFRNVFIVGLEEDLFPSQMMLESRQDLEEERRLFLCSDYARGEEIVILVCRKQVPMGPPQDVRAEPVPVGSRPALFKCELKWYQSCARTRYDSHRLRHLHET
jgi:hypothetical protein